MSGSAAGGPLVSVVMPAWNAAATLERAVRSVLGQTYRRLELILVDDGSTDGTWPLASALAEGDRRIHAVRMDANRGVAAARNRGIALARGECIAFLDSDDWWHPPKLERQVHHMRTSGAAIVYAPYDRVDRTGRVLATVRPPPVARHADMLRGNRIGNLTGIYDRRIGDGRFLPVGHEDYAFWLELVRRAGWAACVPGGDPLACYQVHDGSLSADKWRAARWQWRIYRDIAGLGPLRSGWCFLHYAFNAAAKRSRRGGAAPGTGPHSMDSSTS